MSHRPPANAASARCGIAMLLVLVALAIVVPAGAAALRAAAGRAVSSSSELDAETARLAAATIGPALVEWAQTIGGGTLPEGRDWSCFVRILDQEQGNGAHLTVEVLDLSGRLPVAALGRRASAGLPDQFRSLRPERFERGDSTDGPLFPESFASAAGDGATTWPSTIVGPAPDECAAALWLTDRGRALNINSAPIDLLRAALIGAAPDQLRAALRARERHEPVPPEVARSLTARGDGRDGLDLTDRSDAFGFLVSIERGAARASWWIVVERGGRAGGARRSAPGGEWTITERRRIHP